ncbi:MAG TPA: helix-turn-helix domain-containing protein [Methanocella sp.]|nr:helix-turn-helix domain-containing protein [Methanocella sp.]
MDVESIGNRGKARFNHLQEDLEGISPKTLTDALKILQKEKLISRESYNEIPPRVEYYLTEDGKTLREAIVPLLKWTVERDINTRECTFPCRNVPNNSKRISLK